MVTKKVSIDEYKAWCAEQMTKPGHPIGCDRIPSGATEDYLLDMHGERDTGVVDGFQEKWRWLIEHSCIGERGLMIVPRHLPRYSEDDRHDLWWRLNDRLNTKYLGADGIIYYVPTWRRGDDINIMINNYVDLLERELASLGFIYDEDGNYGSAPGQIDPNLCYVNMNGERRRLADAPSYGC